MLLERRFSDMVGAAVECKGDGKGEALMGEQFDSGQAGPL